MDTFDFMFLISILWIMDMHMAGSPLQDNEIKNVNNGMKE